MKYKIVEVPVYSDTTQYHVFEAREQGFFGGMVKWDLKKVEYSLTRAEAWIKTEVSKKHAAVKYYDKFGNKENSW